MCVDDVYRTPCCYCAWQSASLCTVWLIAHDWLVPGRRATHTHTHTVCCTMHTSAVQHATRPPSPTAPGDVSQASSIRSSLGVCRAATRPHLRPHQTGMQTQQQRHAVVSCWGLQSRGLLTHFEAHTQLGHPGPLGKQQARLNRETVLHHSTACRLAGITDVTP
jgi:hypothetical protein